ncbi:efflux RND transporter permease subunit [Helicobacter mustelae]|uniref:Putative Cadmium-zinc-nickel resistance protein, cznA n=1 Tax=Helicobacter mustelae (strain ATCC 43772 / CCUG 25715 / CIP 103759 / LMG 18044 / NCTC 12198 / R85-136P) TaxID=679897 RepID=D3UHQ0_HELM1|nr:efflux RND transporter permease subunit [Helicobacter mustelae]CBG40022.1 Putative Cadmium-zinc-nickel resistance protein, cznA [Helicobacter mustelae 12198]SQH71534.1 cadmium-zinc-nickel resistance protein CznA [Helicobacter mustelae]
MLAKIIEFSLRQRIMVILCALGLLVYGCYSFLTIPIDAFPDISSTQVKLVIKAPGMAPEEVENRVIRPLEFELLGLQGEKSLRSVSKYAIADITLDFEDDVDIYRARTMVNERIVGILEDLPHGVSVTMGPIVSPLSDMFMFTIDGEISEIKKREIMDFTIRPALRSIRGVADVNSLGGYAKAIAIVPNFNDMARLGISISELERVLKENLKNDGAGKIDRSGETFLVKIQTASLDMESIKNIAIPTKNSYLRLGDFCNVIPSYRTRLGFLTKDGKGEAVGGLVLSIKGSNSKETIQRIYKKFEELKHILPRDIHLNVYYDRSELTQKAVDTVSKTLIEAIILIMITLFLFLGDLRAAVAVSITLPLALGFAFIMMKKYGITANLMSLGGLAIAIGILVDSAVVMVENAFEKLSTNKTLTKLHLIYRACGEIAVSVASGILIIIIFFAPILTLEGLEGKMFRPLAQSIVFALMGSLILSMTVIPVVSSLILKSKEHQETLLVRILHRIYDPTLNFCLKHSKIVFISAFAFLVMSFSLFPYIGKSFMPTLDEGDLVITVETSPSISIDQSKDLILRIERQLLQIKEVKSAVGRTGSDELGLDLSGFNQTDIFVSFIPKKQWSMKTKEELIDKVRKSLENFRGISFTYTQPIDMRVSEMLTGVRGDLAVKVFGNDINELNNLSAQIQKIIEGVRGSDEVFTALNKGVNYLYVIPNKRVMASVGITTEEFSTFLKSSLEGIVVDYIPQGSARIPVLIRQNSEIAKDITMFKSLTMSSEKDLSVPISSIAQIKEVDGPVMIYRENAERYGVIRSNVKNRDLDGFVKEVQSKIHKEVKLPSGYYITYGGQFENQQRANARLLTVIPLSILVIFFILFFTFRDIPSSLLILLNIPFAITGGLISLFLSGQYISVPASVGFITLFGIAVLNGLVMVGYFKELMAQGYSVDEAVERGARRRLRPVLMTACIAALGLIPMLLSDGVGSEVQKPLAVVVLGGLVTSSMLTLLILPPMFRSVTKKFQHKR